MLERLIAIGCIMVVILMITGCSSNMLTGGSASVSGEENDFVENHQNDEKINDTETKRKGNLLTSYIS